MTLHVAVVLIIHFLQVVTIMQIMRLTMNQIRVEQIIPLPDVTIMGLH